MAPRVRVPANVFGFGLALCPAVAYAIYYQRNHPSDQDFEETLRKNYSGNIQSSQAKRRDMVKILEEARTVNANSATEQKLADVLKSGKGAVKRHYAVDEKLYGTAEGVEAKRRAEEEQQKKKKERRKERRRENLEKDGGGEAGARIRESGASGTDREVREIPTISETPKKQSKETAMVGRASRRGSIASESSKDMNERSAGSSGVGAKSVDAVAAVIAVGTLAAVIGFIFGGRRSQ